MNLDEYKQEENEWRLVPDGRRERRGRSRCRAEACCDFLWGKWKGRKIFGARTVSGLLDTAPWLASACRDQFPHPPIPFRPLGPLETKPPSPGYLSHSNAHPHCPGLSSRQPIHQADLLRACFPGKPRTVCPQLGDPSGYGLADELLAFAAAMRA